MQLTLRYVAWMMRRARPVGANVNPRETCLNRSRTDAATAALPPCLPRHQPRQGARILRRAARLPRGAFLGAVGGFQFLRPPDRRAPVARSGSPRHESGGRGQRAGAPLRRRAADGAVEEPREPARARGRALHHPAPRALPGAGWRAGHDVPSRPLRQRARVQGLRGSRAVVREIAAPEKFFRARTGINHQGTETPRKPLAPDFLGAFVPWWFTRVFNPAFCFAPA